MTDTTTTRSTRLGRFGRALTIALVVGAGVAGTASPAMALTSATYDLKGTLPGIDVFGVHSKVLACPVGLGIHDVDSHDSLSLWMSVNTRYVVSREPLQVGVKLTNYAPIVPKSYHLTFRCEGPVDLTFPD